MASDTERRLAAILSADAVGYSRMMGLDEAGTVATLKSQREILAGLVRQHGGRVVDAPGDNLLAELPSVVDAVSCAIAAQRELESRNEARPEARRLRFRIGLHLGDMLVDGERIYGDGINIAARLESLAEPGGICISGAAHEQVLGKVPAGYDDLGEQRLKNIARPVRAFRLRPDARAEAGEFTVPGFGGRPAIAVLAFDNLSSDPEQAYFADGIAEDLITRLSASRYFPIIARNSSFVYKGRAVDAKQVSRELGVRYVVEGAVRRAGDRVRVSAQLIDATSGHHVWAEKFDRELSDLFDLQDEITETILAQLGPELTRVEFDRAVRRKPENPDAWECFLRGCWHALQPPSTQDAWSEPRKGQTFLQRAIELDPRMADAHAALAWSHYHSILYQWSEDPVRSVADCLQSAQRSVELDNGLASGHAALGVAYTTIGQYERAIASGERGVEFDPSSALCFFGLGLAFTFSNRPEEAVPMLEKAMRFSPRDPMLPQLIFTLAAAHLLADRHEEARACAERALELRKDPSAYRLLAAACGHLGRADEARAALDAMLQLTPGFCVDNLRLALPTVLVDCYLAGWRKAGWES